MPQLDRRLWQALSPLLDQALDLTPDERPAFLALLRSSDPALADALEELLADNLQVLTSSFLETPVATARELAPSLAGQAIGAYTLDRPLGMGGMGTVWLARRSDGRFEGKVALKLVNLAVFDPAAKAQFAREGTMLARLAHPNIGRLFDAGVTAAGQPFLVLEYVDGTRIDHYADSRRLTVRARLGLFAQVADAVAHAHANLIVHRDLKPSNILVDHAGQVKLLDFGIAKLIEEETASGGEARTLLTAPALTPRYAAPEQVSGGAVTTATDVYALGVVLYELLVGRHPTTRDEDNTPASQVHALIAREPRRPSDAVRLPGADEAAARAAAARSTSVDRLQRACRGDLDIILAKALKKSPVERYATATAFADDVRRHLCGEPVTVRRDSLRYRASRFVGRHRLGFLAATAVIVALVAGTTIAVVQARESARQRDQALIQLRRAEATNELSTFLLESARPSGKSFSNVDMLARGETLIARRFANDAALRVFMQLTLADRYFDNQQYEARNRLVKQAYEDSRTITDVGLRSYAACHWASNLAEHGEFRQAFALFDAVVPVLSRSPEYVEFEANCLLFETIAANQANDGARAIRAGERDVRLEEQRAIPGSEYEALSALATAYRVGYRYNDSVETFRRAYAIAESQEFAGTPVVTVLSNWSSTLQEMGQMIDAATVGARAVRIARAGDAGPGPGLGVLSTYGNALTAIGNYAVATRILDEALDKARSAGSPRRHIQTLAFALVLAAESGDVTRGSRLVREANAVLSADTSATAYSKGVVDIGTARVALASGDVARAVTLAERGMVTLETATPTQTGLVLAEFLFARCLNAAGRFREARIVAGKSARLVDQRLPGVKRSYQMGQALLEVASADAGLGNKAAARIEIASALEHLHATVGPTSRATERAETLRRELEAR
jgi:serine/threonine protein kinase/tetratricopeptide (TPR) repeat protein